MKFITLTEAHSNGDITPININFAFVQSYKTGKKGKDTHIQMNDGKYLFVKEPVNFIEKLLTV